MTADFEHSLIPAHDQKKVAKSVENNLARLLS